MSRITRTQACCHIKTLVLDACTVQVVSGQIQSVTVQAALYHYLEHCGRVRERNGGAGARLMSSLDVALVALAAGALVAGMLARR